MLQPPLDHLFIREFHDWLASYLAAGKGDDERVLVRRGKALAARRAFYIQAMIRTNPREAIALAVSSEMRAKLPAAVRKHVEVHVKGRGDLMRLIACNPSTGESLQYLEARIGRRVYEAHAYGKLARTEGVLNVPLQGIAIGSLLALADVPGVKVVDSPSQFVRGVPQAVQSAIAGLPPVLNAAGTVRVLVIRVDFSDPQSSLPEASHISAMEAVNQNFQTWSRGRVSLTWDITPVYRLPASGEAYAFPPEENGVVPNLTHQLHGDAVAMAAGYNLNQYDKILVSFPSIRTRLHPTFGFQTSVHFWFNGLASYPVGDQPGRKIWINGRMEPGTLAHEFGHTFGLGHASAHEPGGQAVLGPFTSATRIEYGDPFDTMGNAGQDARHYFGPHGLYTIGWRDRDEVLTIDEPGVYTLKRFDHAGANGEQALVIARGPHYYWFGLRGSFPGNPDISRGAYISLCGPGRNDETFLLDFSPGTATFDDAALDLAMPFDDSEHAIRFEVLEHGGTGPDEYLKIQIGFPELIPEIIEQPQNVTAFGGDRPTMQVRAVGSPQLHYRWLKNDDEPVPFATDSQTLTFPSLTDDHAGSYKVIVSNAYGEATSVPAQLTVVHRPPIRLRRSMYRNTRVELGSVTFRVECFSSIEPTYVWTHDGEPVADASGATLTLSLLEQRHAGRYVCTAATVWGSVRTPFMLKVLPFWCTVGGFGSSADGALASPNNIGYVIEIGAGNQYSVALRAGGDLVAWGRGRSTAELAMLNDVVAIAINEFRCWALRADGTVWEWSEYIAPRQVEGLADIIAIASCGGHFMALLDTGNVSRIVTGFDFGAPMPGLTNVADISAGRNHGVALLNDDTVRLWGLPLDSIKPTGGTLTDATWIASGDFHALVLKADGTTLGIGIEASGASDPPTAVQLGQPWPVLEVAAGKGHSLALRRHPVDDIDPAATEFRYGVIAWGANDAGQSSPPPYAGNRRVFGIAGGVSHSLTIVPWLRG